MQKLMLSAFALLALVATGCGGTGLTGDMAQFGNDLAGAHLHSGTYTVSGLTNKAPDNCQKGIMNGDKIPVANDGTTLTLGSLCNSTTTDPTCSTSGNLEGSGMYSSSTMATVAFTAHESFSDGCAYDSVATASLTFTGNNQASLELNFAETNIGTKCAADEGAVGGGTSCTSDFTMTITM